MRAESTGLCRGAAPAAREAARQVGSLPLLARSRLAGAWALLKPWSYQELLGFFFDFLDLLYRDSIVLGGPGRSSEVMGRPRKP